MVFRALHFTLLARRQSSVYENDDTHKRKWKETFGNSENRVTGQGPTQNENQTHRSESRRGNLILLGSRLAAKTRRLLRVTPGGVSTVSTIVTVVVDRPFPFHRRPSDRLRDEFFDVGPPEVERDRLAEGNPPASLAAAAGGGAGACAGRGGASRMAR